ncbi:MAG: hypothetical protein ACYS0G_14160 [Planctomycetota bacterium]|jgi:hypothetical protein
MRRFRLFVATAVAVAGFQATALGGLIDLRDLPGNFDQFTWGQPDTTIYAQSVLATDVLFNEFRFRGESTSGTDILFNIIVTGDRVDGGGGLGFSPDFNDIRYTSGNLTIQAGTGLNEVTVNPNINVANNERLFIVLNTFSFPTSGSGYVRATEFNAPVDPYLPGEFVFINTGGLPANTLQDLNNFNWSHRSGNNEDLAILASFIPAPGALALLGLAGLAGSRRRRG